MRRPRWTPSLRTPRSLIKRFCTSSSSLSNPPPLQNDPSLTALGESCFVDYNIRAAKYRPLRCKQCKKHLRTASHPRCTNCLPRGAEPLRRCTRCRKVFYCTRHCQIAHWPDHVVFCGLETEYELALHDVGERSDALELFSRRCALSTFMHIANLALQTIEDDPYPSEMHVIVAYLDVNIRRGNGVARPIYTHTVRDARFMRLSAIERLLASPPLGVRSSMPSGHSRALAGYAKFVIKDIERLRDPALAPVMFIDDGLHLPDGMAVVHAKLDHPQVVSGIYPFWRFAIRRLTTGGGGGGVSPQDARDMMMTALDPEWWRMQGMLSADGRGKDKAVAGSARALAV